MPARHAIKPYVADSFYHIYNRGVNRQPIFLDKHDNAVFLSYLKTYLLPKNTDALQLVLLNASSSPTQKDDALRLLRMNNFCDKITLSCFILMPNHFHFLIHQKDEKDIDSFMQSFMTRYLGFFNRKYKRVGPLFQGKYKAVLVETEEQLLYLTRYIHRNPLNLGLDLFAQPSSYPYYLGREHADWIKPDIILKHFSKSGFTSYRSFVESKDYDDETKGLTLISDVVIER